MTAAARERVELERANAELRARLHEAEETLRAIRTGEVDALVVGDEVYSLHGAETAYRILVESMNEGAAIVAEDATLLYANQRLADLLGLPLSDLLGRSVRDLVVSCDVPALDAMLDGVEQTPMRRELLFQGCNGPVPVHLSLSASNVRSAGSLCLVATDLSERHRVEAEIRTLNAELENRVRTRTCELEAANKELEAFSYSVSHDLRAPLRAIDGYSRILLEDCNDRLDDEGRRVLAVVRSETQRMGQLIDALLKFSRLSRQELTPTSVDMTALVRSAFEEVMTSAPGRVVRLDVQELPCARGEPVMLRQVWVNLLANAVKFTSKRDDALIQVGWRPGTEPAYYVRDNGVGFDMAHTDRLFGVFQRLHAEGDFPGTGVGLALVQRIVTRHGGRIWAEARVNGGATFYFTLSAGREGRS